MANTYNTYKQNIVVMSEHQDTQAPLTFHSFPSQVELELLEELLAADDATYPWNPADEASESYFLELEQQFSMQDVLEEELTQRSQEFHTQLDQLWSGYRKDTCSILDTAVTTLKENLQNHLSSFIPSNWLNVIVSKAVTVFDTKQSMSEQLIECVQSVLPTWGAEDLLVLSRPFAYAMRSSETRNMESILNHLENREWTALSEIEKAKATVAIAYYTLSQLNNVENEK